MGASEEERGLLVFSSHNTCVRVMIRNTTLATVLYVVVLISCIAMTATYPHSQYSYSQDFYGIPLNRADDSMKHKRSFASFRFRPKNLGSLIMINRAYDMMNNINSLINDAQDKEELSNPEMEAKAKERAQSLIANRNKAAMRPVGH